jgi:hypothetical protein
LFAWVIVFVLYAIDIFFAFAFARLVALATAFCCLCCYLVSRALLGHCGDFGKYAIEQVCNALAAFADVPFWTAYVSAQSF